MKRAYIATILLLLMMGISFYIACQIQSYNLLFYRGKDDGEIVQFESVVIFGIVFFFTMAKSRKVVHVPIGCFSGILCSILALLLVSVSVYFPVVASIMIVGLFVILEMIVGLFKKDNTLP